MKILYTNADQFSNKRDDLLMFIADNIPDVLMITEMLPKQPNCIIHLLYGRLMITNCMLISAQNYKIIRNLTAYAELQYT